MTSINCRAKLVRTPPIFYCIYEYFDLIYKYCVILPLFNLLFSLSLTNSRTSY